MAKLKSLLKIEGTLDGMTFYKGKDGYLVRTKGGVSKSRIENDPAFIRTRENGSEFGHLAKSGKLLRQALAPLLIEVKDTTVTARVMKLMSQIKNTDTTSIRGSRNVSTGLSTSEGKGFLKGFDFNVNAKLSSVLLTEYQLNQTTGEISIANLNPLTANKHTRWSNACRVYSWGFEFGFCNRAKRTTVESGNKGIYKQYRNQHKFGSSKYALK